MKIFSVLYLPYVKQFYAPDLFGKKAPDWQESHDLMLVVG